MNKQDFLKTQVLFLSISLSLSLSLTLSGWSSCCWHHVYWAPVFPLFLQSCVLRVNIHCDGCKSKVKKILQKIDGKNLPLFNPHFRSAYDAKGIKNMPSSLFLFIVPFIFFWVLNFSMNFEIGCSFKEEIDSIETIMTWCNLSLRPRGEILPGCCSFWNPTLDVENLR